MPGRNQALTRTRCPACSTVFRVTSDQLRAKAGKVRCGYCQGIFNAFDQLVDETTQAEVIQPVVETRPGPVTTPPEYDSLVEEIEALEIVAIDEEIPSVEPPHATSLSDATETPDGESKDEPDDDDVGEPARNDIPDVVPEPPEPDADVSDPEEIAHFSASTVTETSAPEALAPPETAEETTQAAREAGLVAVRELSSTRSFERWKTGALTGDGGSGFDHDDKRRATWLHVVVALLLIAALTTQLAYHFRSELVTRIPATTAVFAALAIPVPLPAHSELISIEASDLRSDNDRGLFLLDASLRNQADFDQDWPALELSLLDASEAVVARRVMKAADYLEPGSDLTAFPAASETPVRLWIDAKDLGASGYRLYIFYP